MFYRKQNHTLDYVILLGTLTSVAVLIRILALTKSTIVIVSLALSLGYILWGIAHHKKAGHIDKKIVLEYVGIAILVNTLVMFLAS